MYLETVKLSIRLNIWLNKSFNTSVKDTKEVLSHPEHFRYIRQGAAFSVTAANLHFPAGRQWEAEI